jgi:phage FluMu protein Com
MLKTINCPQCGNLVYETQMYKRLCGRCTTLKFVEALKISLPKLRDHNEVEALARIWTIMGEIDPNAAKRIIKDYEQKNGSN